MFLKRTAISNDIGSAFVPAIDPPPGVESRPTHPASLARYTHITTGICLPIITAFFLLRTYVRVFIKRTWIFEDVLTTVAWAGTVAYIGIMEATMAHNGGKHAWDITVAGAQEAAYWFNVAAIEYGVMVCVVKLAVLWLYRRVFAPKRWSPLHIAITFLVVILIGFYGATTFAKIFECTPRAKITDSSLPGHCIDLSMVLKTSGSFNFITDYLILFLPIRAVWKLRMSRKKKSLVVLVFTFGLCAPIFATIGFVVRLRNSGNRDKSWRQPEILLWGAAELASGILCVCFPEFGPLLPRFFNKVPHRRRSGPASQPLDNALEHTNSHMLPKRVWRSKGRQENRGRHIMDSGIGLSVYDGGGKSYRERFLPRGWMDSGVGSVQARTIDQTFPVRGSGSKDVSPGSSKTVGTDHTLGEDVHHPSQMHSGTSEAV